MTGIIKYNLNFFGEITKCGFDYNMSNDVVNKIEKLASEVGSPNYVKTPTFKKNHKNSDISNFSKKKKLKIAEFLTEDDWESLRTFQTTQIKENEGIDKEIDSLRCNLNKLSDKNYDNILRDIVTNINTFIDDLTEEEKIKVSLMIFETSSSNRFYSKIYATMYKELIGYYSWLLPVFNEKKSELLSIFDKIDFVDSNEDYNRFCEINNENERRKAYSAFFKSLYELDFIEYEYLKTIVTRLLDTINDFISKDNKKNHVDELLENVTILITKDMLTPDSHIYNLVDTIAQSKTRDFKSLTSKSIFKCMDLLEI